MKRVLAMILAALAITLGGQQSVQAKGCLKGAALGGAAGHYAGHHGFLGAAAGCLIGRHQANKRENQRVRDRYQPGTTGQAVQYR